MKILNFITYSHINYQRKDPDNAAYTSAGCFTLNGQKLVVHYTGVTWLKHTKKLKSGPINLSGLVCSEPFFLMSGPSSIYLYFVPFTVMNLIAGRRS